MRILHLSDIHLQANSLRTDRVFRDIFNTISEVQKELPIDIVIISGDLIDKGGHSYDDNTSSAYNDFELKFMVPLLKVVGVEKSRVLIVPGNHDINRNKIDEDAEAKANISTNDNWGTNDLMDNIYNGSQKGEIAIAWLNDFNNYANSFAQSLVHESNKRCHPLYNHYIFEIDGVKYGFSCLNSAWRYKEIDEHDSYVLLGIDQINSAHQFFDRCDYRIGIIHHPLSQLNEWERNDVIDVVQKHYHMMFFGHTHKSEKQIIENEMGRTLYFCASGIIHLNTGDVSKFKNGFEVIDILPDSNIFQAKSYMQVNDGHFELDCSRGTNGIWTGKICEFMNIQPVERSLLKQSNHNEDYITSQKVIEIMVALKDLMQKNFFILGLSGLGKTRAVYEAVKDMINTARLQGQQPPKIFYCEQSLDSDSIRQEIREFIQYHKTEETTLILDNVDFALWEIVGTSLRGHTNIRIIGLSNQVYDKPEWLQSYIELTPSDMKEVIEEFVDKQIPECDNGIDARRNIKSFAEGFPMLATQLVKRYRESHSVNLHDADAVIEIFDRAYTKKDSDEAEFLKLVALFQPFPPGDDFFDAILNTPYFSKLYCLHEAERIRLRNRVCQNFGSSILEITAGGMVIRPLPLAISLASEWFRENDNPRIFKGLLDYIAGLPKHQSKLIGLCMAQRLQYMTESAAAQDFVAQLTGEGSVFCDENVVCSELGSRLILAMSTVNPLAVINALHRVFSHKYSIEIKKMLSSEARSNIVWALHKLIFDKESFAKAIILLGKLGLEETEQNISNNSIHTFIDAFHVILPGTEASLTTRLFIIRELVNSNSELQKLAPYAITGALAYGRFIRTGGNKFGTTKKEDYKPTSNVEIVQYWNDTVGLAVSLVEKNLFIEEFGTLIKNNLMTWSAQGITTFMLPLLETYGKSYGLNLEISERDWRNFLRNVKRRSKPETVDHIITLHHYYVKHNFVSKLVGVDYDFHNKNITIDNKYGAKRNETFTSIAREFLDTRAYSNEDVLREFLDEKESYSHNFAPVLALVATDDELSNLLDYIYRLISVAPHYGEVPFMSYLMPLIAKRTPAMYFLRRLRIDGFNTIYVRLMARSEDVQLSNLNIITQYYSPDSFFNDYLSNVNIYITEDFNTRLLTYMSDNFDCAPNEIVHFIIRNYNCRDFLTDKQKDIIKMLMLKASIQFKSHSEDRNYWEFIAELLKDKHDESFACIINNKALQLLQNVDFEAELGPVYEVLFKYYLDVIWNDFAYVLFGENPMPFFHISRAISSGYQLHPGMIFSIPEDNLYASLKKYPETAPERLAGVCPYYKFVGNDVVLSDFARYLIDEYGDKKNVLDYLASNIGSFSSVGSVVPIYMRQIKIFTSLLDHKFESVRNWAQNHINSLHTEIAHEETNDSFRSLLYQ